MNEERPLADEVARYIQSNCPRCKKMELRIFRQVYKPIDEIRCGACGARWAGRSTGESLWLLEVEEDPVGAARRIVRQAIHEATGSWFPPPCKCGRAAGAKWLRLRTDKSWDRGEQRDCLRLTCREGACDFSLDVDIQVNDDDRPLLNKFCDEGVRRSFWAFVRENEQEVVLTSWGGLSGPDWIGPPSEE